MMYSSNISVFNSLAFNSLNAYFLDSFLSFFPETQMNNQFSTLVKTVKGSCEFCTIFVLHSAFHSSGT